jgi:hypothetical protein
LLPERRRESARSRVIVVLKLGLLGVFKGAPVPVDQRSSCASELGAM